MSVAGVILAGGLARRLGGGDKPLRNLGGRPILDHVVERLRPQVATLALNANGDPARFSGYGLPVVGDTLPGYVGPLAGILAGMLWARAVPGATHIVTVPGDTPFLPVNLVGQLDLARRQTGADIAVAASAGMNHVVVALWPVDLASTLETSLKEGTRRVRDFLDGKRVAIAEFPIDRDDPFFNINTPEDLAEAERLTGAP